MFEIKRMVSTGKFKILSYPMFLVFGMIISTAFFDDLKNEVEYLALEKQKLMKSEIIQSKLKPKGLFLKFREEAITKKMLFLKELIIHMQKEHTKQIGLCILQPGNINKCKNFLPVFRQGFREQFNEWNIYILQHENMFIINDIKHLKSKNIDEQICPILQFFGCTADLFFYDEYTILNSDTILRYLFGLSGMKRKAYDFLLLYFAFEHDMGINEYINDIQKSETQFLSNFKECLEIRAFEFKENDGQIVVETARSDRNGKIIYVNEYFIVEISHEIEYPSFQLENIFLSNALFVYDSLNEFGFDLKLFNKQDNNFEYIPRYFRSEVECECAVILTLTFFSNFYERSYHAEYAFLFKDKYANEMNIVEKRSGINNFLKGDIAEYSFLLNEKHKFSCVPNEMLKFKKTKTCADVLFTIKYNLKNMFGLPAYFNSPTFWECGSWIKNEKKPFDDFRCDSKIVLDTADYTEISKIINGLKLKCKESWNAEICNFSFDYLPHDEENKQQKKKLNSSIIDKFVKNIVYDTINTNIFKMTNSSGIKISIPRLEQNFEYFIFILPSFMNDFIKEDINITKEVYQKQMEGFLDKICSSVSSFELSIMRKKLMDSPIILNMISNLIHFIFLDNFEQEKFVNDFVQNLFKNLVTKEKESKSKILNDISIEILSFINVQLSLFYSKLNEIKFKIIFRTTSRYVQSDCEKIKKVIQSWIDEH